MNRVEVLLGRYRAHFSSVSSFVSLGVSLAALAGAMAVNFWSIYLATEQASNRVDDLLLSYLPVLRVDGLFVYGTVACVLFSMAVVLAHPGRISFALRAVALFIVIRSAFSLLTHLAPPLEHYASDFGNTVTAAFFGADQFFSAHTGMPLMGALSFWRIRWIRDTFIAFSLYFAAVVLLGHIHYSIDVAAAFFITYGIYRIAVGAFPADFERFQTSL